VVSVEVVKIGILPRIQGWRQNFNLGGHLLIGPGQKFNLKDTIIEKLYLYFSSIHIIYITH
jgi:hypothetical protein